MSTEHAGDYCLVKGKMMMTKAQAKAVAGRLGAEAYQCPTCGKWHIARRGKRPKNKRRYHEKEERKRPFRFRPRR